MAVPLFRLATGGALLALGACAQSPPTVVIDASGLAYYTTYPGLSETDEVFAPEPPRPALPRPALPRPALPRPALPRPALPRPVAPARPILVPNPIYVPVYPPAPLYPPAPIVVRPPAPGGSGPWIPVVN